MTSGTANLDLFVKEYLIFRGFIQSAKQFDTELKVDRDKGFRVSLFKLHAFLVVSASFAKYCVEFLSIYFNIHLFIIIILLIVVILVIIFGTVPIFHLFLQVHGVEKAITVCAPLHQLHSFS